MPEKNRYIVPLLLVAASLASMAFASSAGAQVSGSTGSSIAVTRTPYLSIDATPSSFSFSSVSARSAARDVFSNADGVLPAEMSVMITDARKSGGYILQAQASDFVNGKGDIIPASLMRVVSADTDYREPFDGPKTVSAPVKAATSDFGQVVTFDEVQNLPQNNTLGGPVDILKGCLPPAEGRIGTMSVGLAFTLKIPPYAAPGVYNSTITYTISDFTEAGCP